VVRASLGEGEGGEEISLCPWSLTTGNSLKDVGGR
jgi:hypothetical protein